MDEEVAHKIEIKIIELNTKLNNIEESLKELKKQFKEQIEFDLTHEMHPRCINKVHTFINRYGDEVYNKRWGIIKMWMWIIPFLFSLAIGFSQYFVKNEIEMMRYKYLAEINQRLIKLIPQEKGVN